MRKGIAEAKGRTIVFDLRALNELKELGYKFVQVKGLTIDRHYEYIDPHFLILIPFKKLSSGILEKGIYEPLESDLLFQWASEVNLYTEIVVAFQRRG